MSYSERYYKTIEVPYSGEEEIYCPPSQEGEYRTIYYHGTVEEDVVIEVEVDTDDFDDSVNSCNRQVRNLTGSVAAMNAAQCAAADKNAQKVSQAIVQGFFTSAKTELDTQKIELQQIIDSRLLLLRQQAKMLQEKQSNMEADYQRTSARYQKIFDDLDRELATRVHEIDRPIFAGVEEMDRQSDRMLHTDLVQSVVTVNRENSLLQAQLNAATVKQHALESMSKAQEFLMSKADTERTLRETTLDRQGNVTYVVPGCYCCTKDQNQRESQSVHFPFFNQPEYERTLTNTIRQIHPPKKTQEEIDRIRSYVPQEVQECLGTMVSPRVRILALQMIENYFKTLKQ
jgi:hypothetical protein